MEPLFRNKTTMSKEIYTQLLQFHQRKYDWKYWLYTAGLFLLFVILIAFNLANHYYLQAFLLFIILAGFLAYQFIHPYKRISKEYKSDKVQKHLVNHYLFYDNYFKIKNKFGITKIKYWKLYRVFETDNYFYLYLDKVNILVLDKLSFTTGTTQDFEKFMKHKILFKFKKD